MMKFVLIGFNPVLMKQWEYSFLKHAPESFKTDFNARFEGEKYNPSTTPYEMEQFETNWIKSHSDWS